MGEDWVRLVRVIVIWLVLATSLRIAFIAIQAYRFAPIGERWHRFLRVVRSTFFEWPHARRRALGGHVPEESRTLRAPTREILLQGTGEDPRLMCEPRLVSALDEPLYLSDIDVDGSVLLVGSDRTDWADRAVVVGTDGARALLVSPQEADGAYVEHASIDRGTVAWAAFETAGRRFSAYRKRPGEARELIYEAIAPDGRDATSFGTALIYGDCVVLAVPAGERWELRVVRGPGESVGLGTLRGAIMTRDPVAERHGRRIVSVSLDIPGVLATQDTAILDLDVWPPTVSVVRRGAFLGATTAGGDLVGHWSADDSLSLPGGVVFRLGRRDFALDPVCTGEWAAFMLVSARAPKNTVPRSAVALHIPTGRHFVLAPTAADRVVVRLSTIAWGAVLPAWPDVRMEHSDIAAWTATLPDRLAPPAE